MLTFLAALTIFLATAEVFLAFLIVTFVSFLAPLNALAFTLPAFVMFEASIVTFLTLEPLNAPLAIFVTLYSLPLIVTVAPILTVFLLETFVICTDVPSASALYVTPETAAVAPEAMADLRN